MPESYAELVARLAATRAAQAAEQAEVDAWYEAQVAAARAAVARAGRQVARANDAMTSAQAGLDFTDAEAGRLWLVLGARMRVKDPARLGPRPEPTPEPADAKTGHTVREHPGRVLDHARELLDEVKPSAVRLPSGRLLTALILAAGLLVLILVAAALQ
jgi:hypothetical protein